MQKQKTGTVRIFRSSAYFGMIRAVVVRINGEKVGSVSNNDYFETDLTPGDYQLTVHIDWCRSEPFEFRIDEGQIIRLQADLNGGTFGALFNSFFNWNNLYRLKVISGKSKRKNDDSY